MNPWAVPPDEATEAERELIRSKAVAEEARRAALSGATRTEEDRRVATIESFADENRIATYPALDEDLAAEHAQPSYDGVSLHAALSTEIALVGADVPAGYVAQWLLASYDARHGVDVAGLPSLAATPSRILGHLVALGVAADDRSLACIARRAALLLMNRAGGTRRGITAEGGQYMPRRAPAPAEAPPAAQSMCSECGADLGTPPTVYSATPGPLCDECGRELPPPVAPPPVAEAPKASPKPERQKSLAQERRLKIDARVRAEGPFPKLHVDFTGAKMRVWKEHADDGFPVAGQAPAKRGHTGDRLVLGYCRAVEDMTFHDKGAFPVLRTGTVVEWVAPSEYQLRDIEAYRKRGIRYVPIRWEGAVSMVPEEKVALVDAAEFRAQNETP